MFRSSNRNDSSGARSGLFSVIGPDVVVSGNLLATADLHIDGRVEGDVSCGVLIQGTDSTIVGCVTAATARIAGRVEGTVRVGQLQVETSAQIAGDVEYEDITIAHGARVKGGLKLLGETAGSSTTTVTQIARITELPTTVTDEPRLIA